MYQLLEQHESYLILQDLVDDNTDNCNALLFVNKFFHSLGGYTDNSFVKQ